MRYPVEDKALGAVLIGWAAFVVLVVFLRTLRASDEEINVNFDELKNREK